MKTFILLLFLVMSWIWPSYSEGPPSSTASLKPEKPLLESSVKKSAEGDSSHPLENPLTKEKGEGSGKEVQPIKVSSAERSLSEELAHHSGDLPPTASPSETHFVEFGIEYPINFGIHLKYRLSESIYSRWGLSFMPEFFLSSFTSLAPSFGSLSEDQARLISDTFANSIYLDFRMAWAPYLKEFNGGPYLELGLAGLFYGKGQLKADRISKAVQGISNSDLKTGTYSVKTNAYAITAHIGYQVPFKQIKLNIETGLIKILGSSILSVPTITAKEELSSVQKKHFKKFLVDKGWIFPTVSLWISFGF